jgi:hypothetical protein
VYVLYGGQFRRWFAITAPTSLLASVVVLMADQRIRAIYRSIPHGEVQFHWDEIAETGVLRFGSFFISWFLGCFALAAIATAVNHLEGDDCDSVWKSDSYQRAREHFGTPLWVARLDRLFCSDFCKRGRSAADVYRLFSPRSQRTSRFLTPSMS